MQMAYMYHISWVCFLVPGVVMLPICSDLSSKSPHLNRENKAKHQSKESLLKEAKKSQTKMSPSTNGGTKLPLVLYLKQFVTLHKHIIVH